MHRAGHGTNVTSAAEDDIQKLVEDAVDKIVRRVYNGKLQRVLVRWYIYAI